MSCAKPFLNYLPPVFLFCLIGWLYYSYLVEFCLNYIQSPAKRYPYIVVIHVLLLMFVWSYLQAWCTDGDNVPSEYKMSPMDHIKLIGYDEDTMNLVLHKLIQIRRLQVYTRTDLTRIRYCSKCMQIKPDRTHHCSSCRACVLKMDHHCPWIANCVSFNNQKQFILMLFYGTLLCIFYSGTMLEYVIRYWQDGQIQYEKLHLTIGFVIATSCALLVTMLFTYNLNMSFRNETTLESLREPVFANPNLTFNLGRCNNFVQVFGEEACMWLIPIHTSLGNGYEFPVKNATDF